MLNIDLTVFNPTKTHYQIEKSLYAYKSGGFLGKGQVREQLKNIPDSILILYFQ